MEETSRKKLIEAGIDVADVIDRFMNSEALVEKFLKKFISDDNYDKLSKALLEGDAKGAFTAAHTLKGVCGNLGMRDLYVTVSEQTELLRAEDLQNAKEMMPEVTRKYEKIVEAIRQWSES